MTAIRTKCGEISADGQCELCNGNSLVTAQHTAADAESVCVVCSTTAHLKCRHAFAKKHFAALRQISLEFGDTPVPTSLQHAICVVCSLCTAGTNDGFSAAATIVLQ